MGIKERRERERLELREAILQAAREIANSEGWSGVSIRKIADRVEYSPPMIYEYFENKEDLYLALLIDGFQQLREQLHEVRTQHSDPQAALLAMAESYWDFAFENPDLYRVMHSLDGVHIGDVDKANKPAELQQIVDEVISAMEAWRQQQGVHDPDPLGAFYILWGTLHGIVSIAMSGKAKLTSAQGQQLMRHATEVILTGWLHQHST